MKKKGWATEHGSRNQRDVKVEVRGPFSALNALALAALAGCTGAITPNPGQDGTAEATSFTSSTTGAAASGGSSNTGAAGPEGTATTTGAGGGAALPSDQVLLGEFTRLTRAEYSATVSEALGITPDVHRIPEDGRVGPFTSNVEVTPDPVHPYLLAAEELAALAVPAALPACSPGEPAACVELYAPVLTTLYRRELTQTDLDALAAVPAAVEAGGGSSEAAARALLAAALLSPDFLYRASPSAGEVSDTADLTMGRRLAERVSFALWDAPPDAELRASLRGAGSVLEPLVAEAARLARDPRATQVLARFLGQWLHVDTDLRLEDQAFATSPDYLELLAFVEHAMVNETPVGDFIGGRRGFAHRDNLETYQIDDASVSGEVLTLDWPEGSGRRGLLGQELIAGSTRHPDLSRREIFRGLLVRRSLLCDDIPAPSADLVALASEVGDRTEDVRCSTCHRLMDPIGRAFAVLDPDIDEPVPAPEVLSHPELTGSYADTSELLEAVAGTRAFAECFAEHWLAFFLETPRRELDAGFVALLADQVVAGASLGDVVAQTLTELYQRSGSFTPWCEGT